MVHTVEPVNQLGHLKIGHLNNLDTFGYSQGVHYNTGSTLRHVLSLGYTYNATTMTTYIDKELFSCKICTTYVIRVSLYQLLTTMRPTLREGFTDFQ